MLPMVALIHTKLHPLPLRPDLVPRSRLLERLGTGLTQRRKLTLVVAPAGFGKSTLVAAWVALLAEGPWQTAWISLDARDADPLRFLQYMVAALRRLYPTFAPALFRADDSQAPDLEVVVETIINELAEIEAPTLLVLDDLHNALSPTLPGLLEMLIEYAPVPFHIAITSRETPPLPLPRWQARDQVTQISAVDLRFDALESAAFLTVTMGLQLDQDALQTLEERTEGWVAGLQLAALALRRDGSEDLAQLVSGRDRLIGDYLFSEVFDRQPPDLQRFLLATSLLSRFNASLCNALFELDSSEMMLIKLERANLFLVPLDNQRHWYRYHHLFAEHLQALLRRRMPGAELALLHRRAAEWFADAGFREEAIDHALRGGDPAFAAHLISGTPSQVLWEQGGAAALIAWVAVLPDDVLAEFPRTAFLAAAAHIVVGDLPAALQYLALLAADPQMAPYYQLLHAIILRNEGHIPRAMVQLREAQSRIPNDDLVLQTMAGLQLATNYYESGLLDQAENLLGSLRSRLAAGAAALFSPLLQVVGMQGLIALARADLHRAADLYREGIALVVAEGGALHPMVGQMYSGLGDVYYLWDHIGEAESYYRKTWSLGEASGISDLFSYSAFGLANIAVLRGDRSAVLEHMAYLRGTARRAAIDHIQERLDATLADYELRLGNLDAALRWAARCGLSLDEGPVHQNLYRWQVFLAVRLAEIAHHGTLEKLPQWRRSIDRLLDLVRSSSQSLTMLRLLLKRAVADDLVGERGRAMESVQEALALGSAGGVVRPFLAEGQSLQVLLEHAAQTQERTRYLRRILLGFAAAVGPMPEAVGGTLLEPLTVREHTVLQLIAAGLSNREIEEELVLSRNTVRSHLKNLYGKLGASGRVNAIRRARELNLIESTP